MTNMSSDKIREFKVKQVLDIESIGMKTKFWCNEISLGINKIIVCG